MANDTQTNIRLPAALKDRLNESAKVNKRTLTMEVVARLTESYEREDKQLAAVAALEQRLGEIEKFLATAPGKSKKGFME